MDKLRSKSSKKNKSEQNIKSKRSVKPNQINNKSKSKNNRKITKVNNTRAKTNERKSEKKKKSIKKVINLEEEESPVEISLDEKSQEENENEESEQIEEIVEIKSKSKLKQKNKEPDKKRNNSILTSTKKLLNKKKLKSKSKPKNKNKTSSKSQKENFIKLSSPKKKKPQKKEKFIPLEDSQDLNISENIQEISDSSFNEEENNKSKKKKKSKTKSKTKPKQKKQKKDIQEINIDDYPEDNSLTLQNHNLIEDCCLSCNEKNIFRAINTNDKELFLKCLNSTDKISSIDYNLQIIGNLNPVEFIIKTKNKKLYTEFINFKKNPQKQRITIPKDKLSFLNSGKNNIYTFGFNTRPVGLSRGNKLGNNAFVSDGNKNEDFSTGYDLAIRKVMRYRDDDKSCLFHDDDDFINFNTFAKHQELKDFEISALLNENIDKGNISIVEYLMSVFTAKEIYGYNKLHQLVTSQKPGAEKNLDIKNKMSVNKNNNIHVTPVHLACINPNEKILEELLKNGGETEFQDNMGRKAISYAATCKGPGPLKLLIKKKCNVNDREKAGFTPIIHACRTGRYENVKILLENGADPLLKPRPGQCMSIHFACMKETENNLKIIKLLLDKKPELINMNGSGKKSPLHFAVINNCPKIVEYLIKRGAKINQTDKYSRTALLLSCKYGYSKITKFLIECNANIKKCDNSQNSPLHYACAFGNLDCVKILIENGADINYLNMWKNLPIEIALLKNHFGIVKYLINNDKFSVDTHFGNGNTILLYYLLDIDNTTFDKIKFILDEKNGNGKITNSNKMNAYHFLSHFSYRAYLSTFLSYNEKQKLNEIKHKKVYYPKYIDIITKYINFLKEKGCEPDLENNIGQTPLMLALKNKNFIFAEIYIKTFKNLLDIKHIDNNGFNIFDYAFQNGSSLTQECINFIKTLFTIYEKDLDEQFLNTCTRYGRNCLLNLCEDYALHIYEKFYFINKQNALDFIRCEIKEENDYSNINNINNDKNKKKKKIQKLIIPDGKQNLIYEKSCKDFKNFIKNDFYPLIELFINKGCDINCFTKEKKFLNKNKDLQKNKYFNNYGNIYPIMYLLSYPESDALINLIKKYKININVTDMKNQTLLMYLLEVQNQIKNINENNYNKIFDFLINNCNNLSIKNKDNKNLFITEFEKGNYSESLKIYQKLGDKIIDINDPCYDNYLTLFGNAIINSNQTQIEFLLNNFKNINLNKIDIKHNRNVLHYICMKNSANQEIDFSKFAKYINLKVSLTQLDIFGRNPLFYLFINESNDIKKEDPISSLSYLLESYNEHNKNKKFDLDVKDILGNSLIFYAVEADAVFCVSSLLNKGVLIKDLKNLEKNSIFGYALLGNSNSLPELYTKVNDVKVFEDKIYQINKKPLLNKLKEAEEKIKNNDNNNDKLNQKNINSNINDNNNDTINYCVEELFNSTNDKDNDNESDNNKKILLRPRNALNNENKNNEIKLEEDDNLENLFEENDEGTQMNKRTFQSSSQRNQETPDEFAEYWQKQFNIRFDNDNANEPEQNDLYDFPVLNEEKKEKEKIDTNNKMEEDDANSDESNEEMEEMDEEENININENNNIELKNKFNNSPVKVNIFEFNYCQEVNNLINNYINKNYGDQNYHYQKNYIPSEVSPHLNKAYPKINYIKYKLAISPSNKNNSEIDIAKNEENSEENKLLSDSLFKYCIEKNSQNIIYYILNQGYDEFQAISESLSSAKFKFCMVLLERFNSISTNKLQIKNKKGKTLLHILCDNNNDENNKDLIEKIFIMLTQKINLKKNEFDKDMHTPLYYAVLKNNIQLINLLTNNINESENYLFLQKDSKDNNNKSPLQLLYEKILDKNISNEILESLLKILLMVTKSTKLGYFKNVAIYLSRQNDLKDLYGSLNKEKQNLAKIIEIYQYLIKECNIDINSDIDDNGNNIFFLSVIENNYNLFNDILIKEKNINYNKVNNEGKSLIHYIVSPNNLFSFQNINLLNSAINSGFNPSLKDKEGHTPLYYAYKYKYDNMIKILSKYDKNKYSENISQDLMDIDEENMNDNNYNKNQNINFNYNEVSEKYYQEKIEPFIQQNDDNEDKTKSLVSKDCGLIVANYHVYKDENGCLYNTNLSKVNINKYMYGEFLFYHMQLLVNDKKKMYNLITRWGRFAEIGQHQNTPFTDKDEAIKEFNKLFLSKTGNEWDNIKMNLDNFERKPNKYYLLKLTEKKPEIYNIIKYFNKELKKINISIPKENFDQNFNPNTKSLIYNLIQNSFKNKIENRGFGFNTFNNSYNLYSYSSEENSLNEFNILYFSKESLEKGFKLLSELAELTDKLIKIRQEIQNQKIYEKNLENENSPYNLKKKEYHEISQKILQLSNTYYEIIPFDDKRNYSVRPIDNAEIIKQESDRLQSYTYIEDTLKLFLSSLYYTKLIDPINYIYLSLNKKLIPLNLNLKEKNNKDEKIVKVLLDYIQLFSKNNSNSNNNNNFIGGYRAFGGYNRNKNDTSIITNIFEVIDKNEKKLKNDNNKRLLLFHGTKTQNILGILSKGLLIAPIESESSGKRFGNGIYLSDSFNKALGYCSSEKKKYILLVDTLLDNLYQVNDKTTNINVKELKMKGYNCLINNASKKASFDDRIFFNNGMTIPTKIIEKKEENNFNFFANFGTDYDTEYVIYDPNLVNIKYIIEVEN